MISAGLDKGAGTETISAIMIRAVAGSSLHDAARLYAKAGMFVIPTDPADIKNPVRCSATNGKTTVRRS